MAQNVGIAFVTGRKHFQNVLRTYVNNWFFWDENTVKAFLGMKKAPDLGALEVKQG